jgi:hypothetical protein
MKTSKTSFNSSVAMTITELMVTVAIFSIVILAVVLSHLYGLRLFSWSEAKLNAADGSRKTLSLLVNELRSCRIIDIGTGNQSSFYKLTNGIPQKGTALQIYPTTDTNFYVRYYLDQSDKSLKRIVSTSANVMVIAKGITNNIVFTAEDFSGNILTNPQNNRVIGITMEFYKLQNPDVPLGPDSVFDFYRFRTKITRRT